MIGRVAFSLAQSPLPVQTHLSHYTWGNDCWMSLQKNREGSLEPSLLLYSQEFATAFSRESLYCPDPEVLAAVVSGAFGMLK
jgi:hypothetical protein